MQCPKCQANWKQYKAGFNPSGSQRYRCGECNRVYTPQPIQHGYPEATRLLAIRMYVEGSSFGSIHRPSATRSTHKVLPIGSASTPPSCLMLLCQPRSKRLNWMSCTPSLARKKRDLRLDDCGSTRAALSWDVVLERTSEAFLQNLAWNGHPKPNGTTVMLFLFTIPCTMAHLMKCELTNMKLIRLKPSTQTCATT